MERESEAIATAARRLNDNLLDAVDLILDHAGKVIVTGMGKSGHVARKLAATLQSTGTPAAFLHPAEALHGDFGLCQPRDPVIMISKSGSTGELLGLIEPLRRSDCPRIGILGNPCSPLGAGMNVVLDASVQREADPHNLAPTASAAVALALGHALAVALMEARGFTPEQFYALHPAGQLGRILRTTVREAMHRDEEVAWASPADSVKAVVIAMTRHPLGAACVVTEDRKLLGLITDGDLRRVLESHDDIRGLRAGQVMTASPITIGPEALLHEALRLMEDRPSQISLLPVVEPDGRCLGIIRVHDLYQGLAANRD